VPTVSILPGQSLKIRSPFRTRLRYYFRLAVSTARYLLHTEVHTFAFSVAANAILSFFPFVLLLMTLVLRVFHSPAMYRVIVELLRDYLPAGQDFVIRNLSALATARKQVQVLSFVILLITSTGIFMPLEVALNRVWRFPNNRSYFGNQVISLGLAFACGILALISIALSAGNAVLLHALAFGHDFFWFEPLAF
jgi:membrane protein/epoxyqueuosine reductase